LLRYLFLIVAEYGFFTVILAILSYLSWTKMTLGAALAVIGAFFPEKGKKGADGSASIRLFGAVITIAGAARFAVTIGGIILIIGSVFDATKVVINSAKDTPDTSQSKSTEDCASGYRRDSVSNSCQPIAGSPSSTSNPIETAPATNTSSLAIPNCMTGYFYSTLSKSCKPIINLDQFDFNQLPAIKPARHLCAQGHHYSILLDTCVVDLVKSNLPPAPSSAFNCPSGYYYSIVDDTCHQDLLCGLVPKPSFCKY
jgi:hypothetical protein